MATRSYDQMGQENI